MQKLEIGQKFERYSVLQILGSSGSGTSYKAEDLLLHRKVMLKLIHPWSPLPDSARRQFFRDMHGISLLTHPYHTPMLDYGEVEGQLYIARHFVNHGSLLSPEGRAWYSPPFSIANAIAYAYQLAHVLYYIHRYGYVHGSLTLSNILVSHEPNLTPKTNLGPFHLSDIGLAQFVRRYGKPQITRLPITAAPEQWKGRCVPASDQYALATLIYLWIAGRPPFIGSPDEIAQAKAQASFPLLSSFNPQITLEQEGIIRRALGVHPDERYPNIISFVEALLTHTTRQTKKTSPVPTDLPAQPTITEPLQPPPAEQPQPSLTASPQSSFDELLSTLHIVQPETQSDEPIHNGATYHPLDSLEPISSTFLIDQETSRRLTMLISEDATTLKPVPPIESPPFSQPAQSEPTLASTILPTANIFTQSPPVTDIAQLSLEIHAREETPSMVAEALITENEALNASGEELENSNTQEEQKLPHIALRLLVTSSNHSEPVEFYFKNDEITIGRAGSSDIRLNQDLQASRYHATLRRRGNLYYLFDLHSTNGVFVNEKQLIPETGYPLSDGESFQIGSYMFVLNIVPIHYDQEGKEKLIS